MLCELVCSECVCMCPSSYCMSMYVRIHPVCDWTTFSCHYIQSGGTYIVAWTMDEVVVGKVY